MLSNIQEWASANIEAARLRAEAAYADTVTSRIEAVQERVDTARAGKALLDGDSNGSVERLIRAKLDFCEAVAFDEDVLSRMKQAMESYEEVAAKLRVMARSPEEVPGCEPLDFEGLARLCDERARRYRICQQLGSAPEEPEMKPAERDAFLILQLKARAGLLRPPTKPGLPGAQASASSTPMARSGNGSFAATSEPPDSPSGGYPMAGTPQGGERQSIGCEAELLHPPAQSPSSVGPNSGRWSKDDGSLFGLGCLAEDHVLEEHANDDHGSMVRPL